MKLQLELKNLSELYYAFLKADLTYFKYSTEVEVYELLKKLRSDRNLLHRLANAMQHLPGGQVGKITYESMVTSLSTLEGLGLIDFKITPLKKGAATATLEASDLYFNYVLVLKKSYIGKLFKNGLTRNEFKKRIIDILNKDYPEADVLVTELK